jgi:hypothetical protein
MTPAPVKNAVCCTICRSGATRFDWGFECQTNPCHVADLNTGFFVDLELKQ